MAKKKASSKKATPSKALTGSKHKLSPELQLQVLSRIAQYDKPSKIVAWLKEEHSVVVTEQNIRKNYINHEKHYETIQKLRDKWETKISNEAFASKRHRVIRLQEIHDKAMTPELASVNQFGEIYKINTGSAINALKEARNEIEGISINVSVNPVHDLISEIWDESDKAKVVDAKVVKEDK